MLLLVMGIWVLNLLISFWNAYAVGKAWVETKHAGGWPRFMAWMGAIMSASGFSWCYLIFLALVAGSLGWIGTREMEALLSLGYIVIVPGVLFAGLMITIDSWARAYRERTIANTAVAGYNTFAQMYNTYNAVSGMGEAFGSVKDFFGDSADEDTAKLMLVILLLVIAFGAGIITTWMLVTHFAASAEPLPLYPQPRRI